MNTATRLKILQLILALCIPLSGYISDLFGIDLQFVFYITLLYTGIYVLYVLITLKGRFFRKYRILVYLAAVLLLGQFANRDLFDINRGISGLLDLFVFLGGPLLYTGEEDRETVKTCILRLSAVIVVFTLVITSVSLVTGAVCTLTGRAFLSVAGEEMEIWVRDFRHFVYGGFYRNSNQMGLNAFVSAGLSLYLLRQKKRPASLWIINIPVQLAGFQRLPFGLPRRDRLCGPFRHQSGIPQVQKVYGSARAGRHPAGTVYHDI